MRAAYPLQWPAGWPRTPAGSRARSLFGGERWDPKTSTRRQLGGFARWRDNLFAEIDRMGGAGAVITSNLPTRNDGKPYARHAQPGDPGVAVWWFQGEKERSMACDRWDRIEDNLHALELSIAALRGLSRWGSSEIVDRAFAGFAALPPDPLDWRSVFGYGIEAKPSLADVKARFRELARLAHPDRGGHDGEMQRLNIAMESAERDLLGMRD